MKDYNEIEIGSFEVKSGKVRVTDPCYDTDVWCSGEVDNVKNGKWNAFIGQAECFGMRNAFLVAYTGKLVDVESSDWKTLPFEVGVDSGQAGIFDSGSYKDDNAVQGLKRIAVPDNMGIVHVICEDDPFYSMCCDRTYTECQAGVLPFGCVSSSGLGDGGYEGAVIEKDGEVVAIMIDFGLLNEDEEDEYDECPACGELEDHCTCDDEEDEDDD